MCVHVGEAEAAQQMIYEQLKFIKAQETDGVPSSAIKIRCGCLALKPWKYMHRCLYCSVWFCKECAEEHFGQTVKEYRTKQAQHQNGVTIKFEKNERGEPIYDQPYKER